MPSRCILCAHSRRKKYNVLSDEDLFLHEAIPGHHYQIALQMENTTLPEYRPSPTDSAYAEGWGLYSESLGKELDCIPIRYQYFWYVECEMHRAIRLVVDAGIHTGLGHASKPFNT